jgi:hypothetical protein
MVVVRAVLHLVVGNQVEPVVQEVMQVTAGKVAVIVYMPQEMVHLVRVVEAEAGQLEAVILILWEPVEVVSDYTVKALTVLEVCHRRAEQALEVQGGYTEADVQVTEHLLHQAAQCV